LTVHPNRRTTKEENERMSGEQTRRTNGRVARFRAWLGGLRPRSRWRGGANELAISTGHAVVLGLGVVILALGAYMLVSAYYTVVPTFGALIVGLILIFLGLAETIIEGESDRRRRGSKD